MDTTEMRRRYRAGGVTYQQLAEEAGVSAATVCRCVRGEENNDDLSAAADCLSHTVLQALGDQRQFYRPTGKDETDKLDIKSLKDMTAILRELTELRRELRGDNPRQTEGGLRVVMEGEAEQWSR